MRVYIEAELTEPRSSQCLFQEREEICALGSIVRLERDQQPDHRLTSKPSRIHQEQDHESSPFPTFVRWIRYYLSLKRQRHR